MVDWHISRISYRFGVIRHYIFGSNCLFWPILGVFLGLHTPKCQNDTFLIPKRVFLTPDRVFWAIVRWNWFTGMGCSFVEESKNKKNKSHSTRICWPRGVSTTHRTQTKFGRAGKLPNFITHAKFQIDWNKIVTLAKGWSFMFQHY